MPQPTIRQLTLFVAVAEAGRFNLAAERENISQPALSEQIAQLEHNLGARLFERGRHGATLTPLGEEIAKRALPILSQVRELEDVVETTRNNLGGLIRLGALPTVGPYLLPSVIPELHSAYPELRLYVRELRTVELESRLREGGFDVLLSTQPDDTTGLVIEPLFQEPLLLGLASDHRLAKKKVIQVEELEGEKILTLETGHYLSVRARGLAEMAHAQLLVDYEGTSLDSLRQMVGLGMGISLFPALYVQSEIFTDEAVVVREIGIRDASRWISLVWRKSSPRKQSFLRLAALLRTHAKDLLSNLTVNLPIQKTRRKKRVLQKSKKRLRHAR
jgi:LysR family hydrogen peroxide-inducible transcriptional activator